jgi:hypothetical protein
MGDKKPKRGPKKKDPVKKALVEKPIVEPKEKRSPEKKKSEKNNDFPKREYGSGGSPGAYRQMSCCLCYNKSVRVM